MRTSTRRMIGLGLLVACGVIIYFAKSIWPGEVLYFPSEEGNKTTLTAYRTVMPFWAQLAVTLMTATGLFLVIKPRRRRRRLS